MSSSGRSESPWARDWAGGGRQWIVELLLSNFHVASWSIDCQPVSYSIGGCLKRSTITIHYISVTQSFFTQEVPQEIPSTMKERVLQRNLRSIEAFWVPQFLCNFQRAKLTTKVGGSLCRSVHLYTFMVWLNLSPNGSNGSNSQWCWCSCAFLSDLPQYSSNWSISGSFHRDVLASFCITYPDLFLPVFLAQGWQEWTPETCCDRCFCILRFYLELSGACLRISDNDFMWYFDIDSRLTN